MTTTVHIINSGPEMIAVQLSNSAIPIKLNPNEHYKNYVHDSLSIIISEYKQTPPVKVA